MATILVTRPEKDAERTADRLRSRGHEVIVSPILLIRAIEAPAPTGRIDAAIVASAHVASWMAREDVRAAIGDAPVFAVGDHAADAIRAAGYADVRSASGASADLVELAFRAVAPPARLLAPVGQTHRAEAFDILRGRGFVVDPVVVYDAEAADLLAAEAVAGLRYDVVDAALHYSPRSARLFVDLAEAAGAGDKLERLRHACLSQDVADALPDALRVNAVVAEAPNEDALLTALDAALGAPEQPSGGAPSAAQRPRRQPRGRQPRTIDAEAARVNAPANENAHSMTPSAREPENEGSAAPASDIVSPISPTGAEAAPPRAEDIVSTAAPGLTAPLDQTTRSTKTIETPARSSPQPPRSDDGESRAAPRWAAGESTREPPPQTKASHAPALFLGAIAGALAGACVALLVPILIRPTTTAIDAAQLDGRLRAFAPREDLAATRARIDAIPATLERDRATLRGELDALGARIDSLANAVAAASVAQASSADPDLKQRLDATLQSLQGVAQRLQAVEGKSADIERTMAARAAQAPANAVRRHALANALAQALARGAPYQAELTALADIGAPEASLDALKPYAAGGAPTGRALVEEFKPLAPQIVRPAAAQGGIGERLLASLRGLVRIRPVGETAGDDAASLAARIETSLARGAYADAAAAFDKLPEAARAAADGFGRRLKQRAAADAAAQSILSDAARSLAATSQ